MRCSCHAASATPASLPLMAAKDGESRSLTGAGPCCSGCCCCCCCCGCCGCCCLRWDASASPCGADTTCSAAQAGLALAVRRGSTQCCCGICLPGSCFSQVCPVLSQDDTQPAVLEQALPQEHQVRACCIGASLRRVVYSCTGSDGALDWELRREGRLGGSEAPAEPSSCSVSSASSVWLAVACTHPWAHALCQSQHLKACVPGTSALQGRSARVWPCSRLAGLPAAAWAGTTGARLQAGGGRARKGGAAGVAGKAQAPDRQAVCRV